MVLPTRRVGECTRSDTEFVQPADGGWLSEGCSVAGEKVLCGQCCAEMAAMLHCTRCEVSIVVFAGVAGCPVCCETEVGVADCSDRIPGL